MPVNLNNPSVNPFENVPVVALAVGKPGRFVHVGLLYRNEEDSIRLSHMAWHNRFYGDQPPDPALHWLEGQFNETVLEQIRAFLIHVAEEQGTDIPYSILRHGQSINEKGEYVPAGVGSGLTCSTYILAVFEALEISLLKMDSWPNKREGDQEWFEEILRMLEEGSSPASAEHIAVQRNALPDVVRFRPEEVAASFSVFKDHAVTFEEAEPISLEILERLSAVAPTAAPDGTVAKS